jgi:lipid-A-disaccharide synthase-like uncharacterized protein
MTTFSPPNLIGSQNFIFALRFIVQFIKEWNKTSIIVLNLPEVFAPLAAKWEFIYLPILLPYLRPYGWKKLSF